MDTINDGVQGVNNKLDEGEKRRKNTVMITYNRSLLIQCTSEAYIILCINIPVFAMVACLCSSYAAETIEKALSALFLIFSNAG